MPVDLSIKKVPDPLVERLRKRAKRNHRSLQGELMAILEGAEPDTRTTIAELREYVRSLGLRTPSNSVDIIRADRDAR